jgi:hypothetical protein
VERLSGVRLEHSGSDVIIDLLFASSGIENEVVAGATRPKCCHGYLRQWRRPAT